MLAFLAVVSLLIIAVGVHEWGHFVAASYFKVGIKKIAIGFGKPLIEFTSKKGYRWAWNRWPLGGYVALVNTRIEPIKPFEEAKALDKKPVSVRIIIFLAGSVANLVTAFLALTLMFLIGYQQINPVISTVVADSPAASAQLQPGDQIQQINHKPMVSWQQAAMMLVRYLGASSVPLTVKSQDGQTRQLTLNLSNWDRQQKGNLLKLIGIIPDASPLQKKPIPGTSLIKAAYSAWNTSIQLLFFFLIVIKQLLIGVLPFSLLLGPIGLFMSAVDAFSQGVSVFLYLIADLSLAMALVNLMPLPGLDGGSIVFALVEKLRGKPLSVPLELLIYRLTWIVFWLVFIQLVLNDLKRWFI